MSRPDVSRRVGCPADVRADGTGNPGSRARVTSFATQAAVAPVQPLEPLTEREEAVLRTVARARTNTGIGSELHISMSTVTFHLAGS